MAYLMEDRLKVAADVAEATMKEKFTVAENAEAWAQEAERARAQAD